MTGTLRFMVAVTLLVSACGHPPESAPLGIGASAPGTPTFNMAAAIATVVNRHHAMDLRAIPFGGTAQVVPLVEQGELQFGLANVMEYRSAISGDDGMFEGRLHPTLRLVGGLFPFRTSFVVRADSAIRRIADLRGRRIPVGFQAQPIATVIVNALLASDGLTSDEVVGVPVVSLREALEELVAGRLDATPQAVGARAVAELERSMALRFVSIGSAINARGALGRLTSQTYPTQVQPNAALAGIEAPTTVLAYNYLVREGDG